MTDTKPTTLAEFGDGDDVDDEEEADTAAAERDTDALTPASLRKGTNP